MSNEANNYDVVVVGCGMMGSAIARTLASAGHAVAAWNRSPEKAEALADAGVPAVRDLPTAVERSRVVLVCSATYESARASLAEVRHWHGKTLVNVGSGTFDEIDALETWAAEAGVDYLDGAILAYPHHLGTPAGVVLFAGPADVWAANHSLLGDLGRALHVSSRVRGASVLDGALIGSFFISALAAYVEAATFAHCEGVSAGELETITEIVMSLLGEKATEMARAIESGQHDTDQAKIGVFAAGARMCADTMRAEGYSARMTETAADLLTEAEGAGLGDLGFSAMSTSLPRP